MISVVYELNRFSWNARFSFLASVLCWYQIRKYWMKLFSMIVFSERYLFNCGVKCHFHFSYRGYLSHFTTQVNVIIYLCVYELLHSLPFLKSFFITRLSKSPSHFLSGFNSWWLYTHTYTCFFPVVFCRSFFCFVGTSIYNDEWLNRLYKIVQTIFFRFICACFLLALDWDGRKLDRLHQCYYRFAHHKIQHECIQK